jgi:hypothetical protein
MQFDVCSVMSFVAMGLPRAEKYLYLQQINMEVAINLNCPFCLEGSYLSWFNYSALESIN